MTSRTFFHSPLSELRVADQSRRSKFELRVAIIHLEVTSLVAGGGA